MVSLAWSGFSAINTQCNALCVSIGDVSFRLEFLSIRRSLIEHDYYNTTSIQTIELYSFRGVPFDTTCNFHSYHDEIRRSLNITLARLSYFSTSSEGRRRNRNTFVISYIRDDVYHRRARLAVRLFVRVRGSYAFQREDEPRGLKTTLVCLDGHRNGSTRSIC